MAEKKASGTKMTGKAGAIIAVVCVGPIVAALVLRLFVVEAFKIPSGSMTPTLLIGDHVLALKGDAPPTRGEVVVFRYPEKPDTMFVSRVVALPGETWETLDGRLVVDGKLAPRCYVGVYTSAGETRHLYLEKVGDRLAGVLQNERADGATCTTSADCIEARTCQVGVCARDVMGPFYVKPGQFWVAGDNRDNSHDSRRWAGGIGAGVPVENLVGRPSVVFASSEPGRFGSKLQGLPVLPEGSPLRAELDRCVNELSR